MSLVLRSEGDPLALVAPVREIVHSVDPDLPVNVIRTLEQQVAASVSDRRFNMALLGGFAAIALCLAVIVICGVTAFTVSQRTREIGVRVALGASARDVLAMVFGQGMRWVWLGLALGMAGALTASRLMESLLFGVSGTDLPTMFAVVLTIVTAAAAALLLPARRATRVAPAVSLHHE